LRTLKTIPPLGYNRLQAHGGRAAVRSLPAARTFRYV